MNHHLGLLQLGHGLAVAGVVVDRSLDPGRVVLVLQLRLGRAQREAGVSS